MQRVQDEATNLGIGSSKTIARDNLNAIMGASGYKDSW